MPPVTPFSQNPVCRCGYTTREIDDHIYRCVKCGALIAKVDGIEVSGQSLADTLAHEGRRWLASEGGRRVTHPPAPAREPDEVPVFKDLVIVQGPNVVARKVACELAEAAASDRACCWEYFGTEPQPLNLDPKHLDPKHSWDSLEEWNQVTSVELYLDSRYQAEHVLPCDIAVLDSQASMSLVTGVNQQSVLDAWREFFSAGVTLFVTVPTGHVPSIWVHATHAWLNTHVSSSGWALINVVKNRNGECRTLNIKVPRA